MRLSFLIILFFTLIGCKVNDRDYFNGTIREVTDRTKTDTSKIKKADLIDLNLKSEYVSPQLLIHDSIMICYLFADNNYFFNLVNLKSGDLIGQFCHKGNGNNELLYCMELDNLYTESGELKALVTDTHKNMLYKWNISKSIETKETVFDTTINFKIAEPDRPYTYTSRLNDSTLFGYLSSGADDFARTKPVLHAIELRDIFSETVFKTIHVFKDTFEDEKPPYEMINQDKEFIPALNYFRSMTDVKPDCKYAVQAMKHLAQLNIITIETGEVKGIRLKETPDFSIFSNYKNIKNCYFTGILRATDDAIYVGYSGESLQKRGNKVKYLYKFDWNGDVIDVYDLGLDVNQLLYDKATNQLYAFDSFNLKLYLVNLS